jgi:hypothetical protein
MMFPLFNVSKMWMSILSEVSNEMTQQIECSRRVKSDELMLSV